MGLITRTVLVSYGHALTDMPDIVLSVRQDFLSIIRIKIR